MKRLSFEVRAFRDKYLAAFALLLTLCFSQSAFAQFTYHVYVPQWYDKLRVDSSIVFPSISSSILKTDAAGRLFPAVSGTDYVKPFGLPQSLGDTSYMHVPYMKVDSLISSPAYIRSATDVIHPSISGKELVFGNNPVDTSTARFAVSDSLMIGQGYHSIGDYSIVQQPSSGSSFASFDVKPTMTGTQDWGHFIGLQTRPIYTGSGNITNMMYSQQASGTHSGTGTIYNYNGLRVEKLGGTGPVTNYYGIYIKDPASRGTTINYALYSEGGSNFFGGPILYANTGTGAPTFTTRSAGAKLLLWPNLSGSTVDYGMGMLSNGIWFSVPTASSSNYFRFYGGTTAGATIDGTGQFIAGSSGNPSSTLQSGGSFATTNVAISANTTLTSAHQVVRITTSGITITLPAASTCNGRIYDVINESAGSVTISSVQVYGSSTTSIPTLTSWTIYSDGANWRLLSRSN